MKDAAVGISTVTEPSGHSRNGHFSTENPSCFDLPRNRVDERPRDCRPIKLCAMIVDHDGLAVIGQNIALGHDFAQPINECIQYGGVIRWRLANTSRLNLVERTIWHFSSQYNELVA